MDEWKPMESSQMLQETKKKMLWAKWNSSFVRCYKFPKLRTSKNGNTDTIHHFSTGSWSINVLVKGKTELIYMFININKPNVLKNGKTYIITIIMRYEHWALNIKRVKENVHFRIHTCIHLKNHQNASQTSSFSAFRWVHNQQPWLMTNRMLLILFKIKKKKNTPKIKQCEIYIFFFWKRNYIYIYNLPGSILSAFFHTREDSTERERERKESYIAVLSLWRLICECTKMASDLQRQRQRIPRGDQGQFGHIRIKTCPLQLRLEPQKEKPLAFSFSFAENYSEQ